MANNAKKREPLYFSLVEAQCNEEARILLTVENPKTRDHEQLVLKVGLDQVDMLYNAVQEASEILENEDASED